MRILCSTDLSAESLAAARLSHALVTELSTQDEAVDLEFLHVLKQKWFHFDRGRPSPLDDPDNLARLEKQIRQWFADQIGDRGYGIKLLEGKPAAEIADYAAETDVDFLVVGQTGSGIFTGMQLGSTAYKLAHQPPCDLLITHREFSAFQRPRRLAVAVDLEEVSALGLQRAANLAQVIDAELDIIHVVDLPGSVTSPGGLMGYLPSGNELEAIQRQARADLTEFLDLHDELLEPISLHTSVVVGSPTRRIIDHARERDVDILCLGTVSMGTLETAILGSVVSGVIRHMPCTTLLVPPR